jgi:hypothetical protein
MMRRAITAVVALAVPLALHAAETKVRAADVPAAVRAAVAKSYPAAKITGYAKETDEKGKTAYEIALRKGGQRLDVSFAEDGKFLSEEAEVKLASVPPAVKKAFAGSKYGTWKVGKVERVVTGADPKPTWEIIARSSGEQVEAVFDESGKMTKDEVKKGRH